MKNKQHEYILRAFLASKIPPKIKENAPELMVLDADVAGYCTQLLHGKKTIDLCDSTLLSSTEKDIFSRIINQSEDEKNDLVIYYRLFIIADGILQQYRL